METEFGYHIIKVERSRARGAEGAPHPHPSRASAPSDVGPAHERWPTAWPSRRAAGTPMDELYDGYSDPMAPDTLTVSFDQLSQLPPGYEALQTPPRARCRARWSTPPGAGETPARRREGQGGPRGRGLHVRGGEGPARAAAPAEQAVRADPRRLREGPTSTSGCSGVTASHADASHRRDPGRSPGHRARGGASGPLEPLRAEDARDAAPLRRPPSRARPDRTRLADVPRDPCRGTAPTRRRARIRRRPSSAPSRWSWTERAGGRRHRAGAQAGAPRGRVDVPGQTEMLQDLAGARTVGMLMAAERTRLGAPLRVLLATTHLPLRDVPAR